MAGEDLPGTDERVTLAHLETVVRGCADLLDPDPTLLVSCGFDQWDERMVAWLECGASDCECHTGFLRYALEDVTGGDERADKILDALRLSLSCFLLAQASPYTDVVQRPDGDLETLGRKAIDLYTEASEGGTVNVHYTRENVERVHHQWQQDWLGDVIERAYRPGSQN